MKRSAVVLTLLWAAAAFASGEWKQIGKAGDWGKTRGGVVIGTYSVETGGTLYGITP